MFDESMVVNDDISHALQFAAIAVVGSQALWSSAEVRPLPITIFFDPRKLRIGENFDPQNRSSKVQITQIGALSWPFFLGGPETVVVLKYEQKIHEISEILKYAQKVPILVFGIGIRLNLSVLELLELFEKKERAKVPIVCPLKSRRHMFAQLKRFRCS